MLQCCPKCHHQPLPLEQAPPAACPGCGVILAKAAQRRLSADEVRLLRLQRAPLRADAASSPLLALLLHVPAPVERSHWWARLVLWAGFGVWGMGLIALDHRTGEINTSFLHGPLLVFHEAGHVIFAMLGSWMMVLGGTLAQLIMPVVLMVALLRKNHDPFGAALGLWLLGVSVLDVAPYMYDALDPQLMLLSGATGEEGGHDWIFLFKSLGWLRGAQGIGTFTHRLGALVVLLALAWAGWVLVLQWRRLRTQPPVPNSTDDPR